MTIMSPNGAPEAPAFAHGVAVMQQIVGAEILDQVAERPLDGQRQEYGPRDVPRRMLGLLPHGSDGFETDQDQDGDGRLDKDKVEPVGINDRGGRRMVVEHLVPLIILGDSPIFIVDRERCGHFQIGDCFAILVGRHRHTGLLIHGVLHLKDRFALLVHGRLAGSVEHRQRISLGVFLRHLGDLVVHGDAVGKVVTGRSLGMLNPIADGHQGEYQQGRDLDDIDHHIDGRRARYSPEGDVGHPEGEDDAKEKHEKRAVIGAAESIREKLAE